MNNKKKILSIVAFALLLAGVFLPFVGRLFGSPSAPIWLAIGASVLALIFGLLARSFLLGRIAWIGALIVCVLGTINAIRFFSALERQSFARAWSRRLVGDHAAS